MTEPCPARSVASPFASLPLSLKAQAWLPTSGKTKSQSLRVPSEKVIAARKSPANSERCLAAQRAVAGIGHSQCGKNA